MNNRKILASSSNSTSSAASTTVTQPLFVSTGNENTAAPSIPQFDDELVTGSIPSSMINILNTILGSGMLALPSAISSVGLVIGIGVIAFFGFMSAMGLYLLTICAAYVGRSSSFNSISKITYPNAAIIFDLAIAIKCFGVGVSYLVIIGDLMPKVVVDFFPTIDPSHFLCIRQFWITAFMVIVAPLSFVRRLDSLKYTSFVALFAVVYLVFLTVYYYFDPGRAQPDPDTVHLWNPTIGFLKSLPVFVFAFTCHQNIFSVYNELRQNTPKRINTVTWGSIIISTLVYWAVGTCGYLMFGDNVKDNMLINFPSSVLVTIARISITILVALSYPLQCHPSRASFDKFLAKLNQIIRKENENSGYAPISSSTADSLMAAAEAQDSSDNLFVGGGDEEQLLASPKSPSGPAAPDSHGLQEINATRFHGITVGILIVSYLIAFFVKDLQTVLSFVGSTGSTTICFILPGLFYLKLKQGEPWTLLKFMALFLTVLGCIVMPTCITFIIIDI